MVYYNDFSINGEDSVRFMHDNLPRIQSYRHAIITFLLAIVLSYGQNPPEQTVLLGSIQNKTASANYSHIHFVLHRLLVDLPQFPQMLLDTTLGIDSFPNEISLTKARALNASYMMWGVVDSSEPGLGISFHILDMKLGSLSHIRVMINKNESGKAIAEMVRSKIKLWLQRSTMVQLIVTTQPTEAGVLIDGNHVGSTPFEGMVQPGSYRLELSKKAHTPIRFPVSFISGNTYQYDFTMNPITKKTDKRSAIKWVGLSVVCLGGGVAAHMRRDRALARYREATPPADFNRLHNNAVAWEIGRDLLFAAAAAALCGIVFQVGF